MLRRQFLSTLAAAALAPAANPKRPNIILMMADDMGFSDLGCYGSEISTPNLDSLAKGGLRFTQFYNTARCCPTRAALMTGLYSHQAGVGHMVGDYGKPGYRGDLNKQCVTVAEVMRSAGYRTAMAGKWHVTPAQKPGQTPDKHNWPLQRGFEKYFGTIHGAGSYYDPVSLTRDNTPIEADRGHSELFWEHEGNRAAPGDVEAVLPPSGQLGAIRSGSRPHRNAQPCSSSSRRR